MNTDATTLRTPLSAMAILATAFLLAITSAAPASAQALVNGANQDGTIAVSGETDTYTFSANVGDYVVLRIGQMDDATGQFDPFISVMNPSNVSVGASAGQLAAEVAIIAAASGTFTVVVADGNVAASGVDDTGGYRLTMARSPGTFTPGDDGAASIDNGATLQGTIDVGDLDMWSFTAAAGEGFVVRMGEMTDPGGFNPWIRVFGPTGTLLGSHAGSNVAEVAANATTAGTYTIVVGDGNVAASGIDDSGTYRLQLAKNGSYVTTTGDEGGEMSNGQTVAGTLSMGDLDLWSVTVSAGAGIVARAGDVTDSGGLNPWIRIFSPTGVLLESVAGTNAADAQVTAPSSGTYVIVVADGNVAASDIDDTGTYRLHVGLSAGAVTVSSGDEGGDLPNGATLEGTIHVGDLDVYAFTATSGEGLVVRMGQVTDDNGSFNPWIRLYAPSGTLLDSTAGSNVAEASVAAPVSGTYIVIVGDGNVSASDVDDTGTYRLHLAKGASPFITPGGDDGGDLVNGATHTGTIHTGDLDLWSFTASAGEGLVVRMGEVTDDNGSFNPWVRVYSPTGLLLGSVAGTNVAEVAWSAPSSGTYTVVLSDGNVSASDIDDTGAYRVHMARELAPIVVSSGDEGGDLVSGATFEGTIHAGDLDVYSFPANAGEGLVVRAGQIADDNGSFNPWLRLYSPTGVLLGSVAGSNTAEISENATATGTYTVVISDGNVGASDIDDTGTYRLNIARGAGAFGTSTGDEGGDLLNGATHQGTLLNGDLDLWSFPAVSGESIVVRIGEVTDDNGGFNPWVRVFGPTGTLLGSVAGSAAAESSVTAPSSGVYTVVLSDGNVGASDIDDTGTYRIHLAKVAGAFVVGDEGGVRVPAGQYAGAIHVGDLDMWSFCASAGDVLSAQMTEITDPNGSFNPWVRLYGPTGQLLSSIAGTTTATGASNAPATGTYTVVLSDGNVGASDIDDGGTYNLIVSGNSGCATSCLAAPTGLVSWWTGNGTTADARDGNNGVLENGATYGTGKVSQGFDLDGNDDDVRIADSGNLNLTNAFTWDAWVNPASLAHVSILMDKELSLANRVVLRIETDGRLCGYFDDTVNSGSRTCSSAGVVPTGQFTHVAMVLDSATELRLYANALLVAHRSGVGSVAGNTSALILGKSPSEGQALDGVIDEIDVFNRALSQAEITAIVLAAASGKCTGCSSALNCDDQNGCTNDDCIVQTGQCTHVNNAAACNDGNACTAPDACSGGTCTGGPAPNCDDGNPCTTDSCNTVTGCTHVTIQGCGCGVNGTACNDGNACTMNDACQGGICVGGSAPNCDDGNVCTNDSCNAASGCVHANNAAPCNDANACTTNDACSNGACAGGAALGCDDGNACTNDTCSPAGGCAHGAISGPCNDGNACTTNDACQSGVCVGGAAPNCNDGNPCTNDTCAPASGCGHANNSVPCNDGNACTTTDICAGGACVGSGGRNCDDHNSCTDDTCSTADGCVHVNNTVACSDGNACTLNDACSNGACTSGPPLVCEVLDQCHELGVCNPGTGQCSNPAKVDGTVCDDGVACTLGDTCQAGACTGGPGDCGEVHDFAIVKLTVPNLVRLDAATSSLNGRIKVRIQNRSAHTERIRDYETLAALIAINVESLGLTCTAPQATLIQKSPNGLPIVIRPKAKANVFFRVTFSCANDPAKSTATDPNHGDFAFSALLHHSALDGKPDTHPADDLCPREPLGLDQNPDGSITDTGCGGARGDGTFGNPVVTDVVRR